MTTRARGRPPGHASSPSATAENLHHIGIGRTQARTRVLMLVCNLHVRVINAAIGELIRELTLNPDGDYQPTGRPPGPPPGTGRKTRQPEP